MGTGTKIQDSNDVRKFSRERGEPSWLLEHRLESFRLFRNMPPPSGEDWKYTKTDFTPEGLSGRVNVDIQSVDGIVASDMKTAIEENERTLRKYLPLQSPADRFSAYAAAFWDNGVFVFAPEGAKGTMKANVVLDGRGFTRSLIIAGSGSSLNFSEELTASKKVGLHLGHADVHAMENSKIRYGSIQNLPGDFTDLTTRSSFNSRGSRTDWCFGLFGGNLSRLRIDACLMGEESSSNVSGMFFCGGKQHMDVTTNICHPVRKTSSNVVVKGVLDGESTSVYRGKIRIPKRSSGTVSYLTNNNLMLSAKAVANSVPSLEIDNNEVKASHASTTGEIDREQLFYLSSRGISRKHAERLIIGGFVESVFAGMGEDMKKRVSDIISGRMENA